MNLPISIQPRSRPAGSLLIPALAALALATSACAADDPVVTPMEVTADDFSFEIAAVPDAGTSELIVNNLGAEPHHIQVLRLDEGVDPDQAAARLEAGDISTWDEGTFVGGPGAALPGKSEVALTDLEAGNYLIFCEIPSPVTGRTHFEEGMVATFAVTGDGPATAPDPEATLRITDEGYQLPDSFDGIGPLLVTNDGSTTGQAEVFRLVGDATIEDVVAFLIGEAPGPPPYATAGGVTTLGPGQEAVAEMNLEPGRYAVLSFAPDPTTGAPGFLTGHLAELTIA